MKPTKSRVLECIECRERFSLVDVAYLRFFPEGMTCLNCYRKLCEVPRRICCFGKENQPEEEEYGYDPKEEACSALCMDRYPCSLFVSGKIERLIMLTVEQRKACEEALFANERAQFKAKKGLPFSQGSISRQVFEMCLEGITKRELLEYVEEIGGNYSYYLRILRKEFYKGYRWKLTEEALQLGGKLKVELL